MVTMDLFRTMEVIGSHELEWPWKAGSKTDLVRLRLQRSQSVRWYLVQTCF